MRTLDDPFLWASPSVSCIRQWRNMNTVRVSHAFAIEVVTFPFEAAIILTLTPNFSNFIISQKLSIFFK